jgi:hypothetical protein
MTSSKFRVQCKICNGGDGPAVDVRIFERIEGTRNEFLSPSSFVADLQCLPALLTSLTLALAEAEKRGLLNNDHDLEGCPNARRGGHD